MRETNFPVPQLHAPIHRFCTPRVGINVLCADCLRDTGCISCLSLRVAQYYDAARAARAAMLILESRKRPESNQYNNGNG